MGIIKNIKGEIYEVNENTLEFLNKFEGVHLNTYSSVEIEVKDNHNQEISMLKTYIVENFNEDFFMKKDTTFLDNYTEKIGGNYLRRDQDEHFNLEEYIKQIKKA